MGPELPLPLPVEFSSTEEYIESLLQFATSSWLLQTLCGGVHILDFYTRSPDLYSTILPHTWREWFKTKDIMDILDLLMREDLTTVETCSGSTWRDGPSPPEDLLNYVRTIRRHLLVRDFPLKGSNLETQKPAIPRHIALGMKVKKVHEVDHFARYVDRLTSDITATGKEPITHLIDFGSGQNYLGRALAAPPYSKHLVAVESKQHNIEGAKNMDVMAKLVPKPLVMRNKKEWRAQTGKLKTPKNESTLADQAEARRGTQLASKNKLDDQCAPEVSNVEMTQALLNQASTLKCNDEECTIVPSSRPIPDTLPAKSNQAHPEIASIPVTPKTTNLQIYTEGQGSVQYVEHIIKDGDLTPVINQVIDTQKLSSVKQDAEQGVPVIETDSEASPLPKSDNVNAMVISLHSCGNLVHHGLRSMLLNPHISAVAMVGCCYNLVTERLGPPTYKLPTLRPDNPRLKATSNVCDPNGFPMSERLATYPLPHTPATDAQDPTIDPSDPPKGIRFNITARMMAVQAPFNWGPTDSELFFTRHFYRALLQRIFLDRGVISAPVDAGNLPGPAVSANGHTSHVNWTPPNGRGPGLSSDGTATPLTIGTLRKFAYTDFVSYVRAAIGKLVGPNSFCQIDPAFIREKMDGLTDEEIKGYEVAYADKKKELSVMWSLMAFSAGAVESVIVVDRWLWLKEQESVDKAWVESVFEYKYSPRNFVVVGVKK